MGSMGPLRSCAAWPALRFIDCVKGWKTKLIECHFQELVFEDAMDLLLDQVSAIGRDKDPMTLDLLITNLRDDMVSNMIVMFLRLVTSAAIQQREEFFMPFIMVRFRPRRRNARRATHFLASPPHLLPTGHTQGMYDESCSIQVGAGSGEVEGRA
jgi:hypothetical protein